MNYRMKYLDAYKKEKRDFISYLNLWVPNNFIWCLNYNIEYIYDLDYLDA
jgi:hypothetical protein